MDGVSDDFDSLMYSCTLQDRKMVGEGDNEQIYYSDSLNPRAQHLSHALSRATNVNYHAHISSSHPIQVLHWPRTSEWLALSERILARRRSHLSRWIINAQRMLRRSHCIRTVTVRGINYCIFDVDKRGMPRGCCTGILDAFVPGGAQS